MDRDSLREAISLQLPQVPISHVGRTGIVDAVLDRVEKELERRHAQTCENGVARKSKCALRWASATPHGSLRSPSPVLQGLTSAAVALLKTMGAYGSAMTVEDLETLAVEASVSTEGRQKAAGRPHMHVPCLRRISSSQAQDRDAQGGDEAAVWAFDLFDPLYCAELESLFQNWSIVCHDLKSQPNSMNRHGMLVEEAGWSPCFTDVLLEHVIRPLASVLFGRDGGGSLDNHKAFTVVYNSSIDEGHTAEGGSLSYDVGLATHFDNAEVTLNVNVGGEWNGGDLELYGGNERAPRNARRSQPLRVPHRRGVAILHRGRELHAALPVSNGTRTNLVVWARSTTHREAMGCPMCGERIGSIRADAPLKTKSETAKTS